MEGKYFLGIDLGTSACKAVLYDLEFNTLFKAGRETRTFYPRPTWAEQDPTDWWRSATEVIREAVSKADISPEEIAGAGTCGMCHGPTLVDRKCEPVTRTLIWPDLRAVSQAEKLNSSGLYSAPDMAGFKFNISAHYTLAKLMWLRENQPEVIKKSYKVLLPKDFLRARMTGVFCTDKSDARGTQMLNSEGDWSKELCDFIGFPMEKLPKIRSRESIVGKVTADAAKETGLCEGIPMIAGQGDGATEPVLRAIQPENSVLACMGTSHYLTAYTKDRVMVRGGVSGPSGGGLIKWFKEQFTGLEEEEEAKKLGVSVYKILDEKTRGLEPGSGGLIFLPHMMGERTPDNPHAKAVLFGLSLGHRKEHVFRGLMEGVAFQLRFFCENAENVKPDLEPQKVIVYSGGAKSRVWRQIIADVLGLPTYLVSEEETGTLNLACLISVGLGLYKDISEAAEHTNISLIDEIIPRKEMHERYNKLYRLYKNVDASLEEAFSLTADL